MGAIPPWNDAGLLDPVDVNNTLSFNRAPYRVSLKEVVEYFSTSAERRKILRGFLAYRAALHDLGLVSGFQWLDGSFVEDIESNEGRAPGDIDILTFYELPKGETQQSLLEKAPYLFPKTDDEKDVLKGKFGIDGLMSSLNAKPALLVKQATFWYGVWSHRRDFVWKGFLQVDLAPNDKEAIAALDWADEIPNKL